MNLKFIKDRRLQLELTMQDVANALNLKHKSTYYRYEVGKRRFQVEQLSALASILQCELKDLFEE